MEDEFFESTASESDARAGILPTKPTEDVSALLGKIEPQQELRTQSGYLPCPAVDWVVELRWKDSVPGDAKWVATQFKGDRWEALGPATVFGKDAATGKWTYLVSANAPEEVTELKLAWPYFATWREPAILADAAFFEERIATAESIASKFEGGSIQVIVDPVCAAKRVHELARLHERFGGELALRLKAPVFRKFQGKVVWDVMLCLGLRWGDMDQFHWRNELDCGGDFHFTVSTSSAWLFFA